MEQRVIVGAVVEEEVRCGLIIFRRGDGRACVCIGCLSDGCCDFFADPSPLPPFL